MRATIVLALAGLSASAQTSPPLNPGPLYAGSSIVNSASPLADALAPNTLTTLYGAHLAHVSRAVTAEDVERGTLPTVLPNTGVRVMVSGVAAPILYVSPAQVNFLIPPEIPPGTAEVRLVLDSRYGPAAKIRVAAVSPALFQADPEYAIATRVDGSLVTPAAPAAGGEIITLYATGLGLMRPQPPAGQLVRAAAPLERIADFRVQIGGVTLAAEHVLYAGAAPGFAGLYQINLRLPDTVDRDPEVRIGFGETRSPNGVRLPAGR